ncbi:gliding motility-associated C-terminal domain-containing protein [Dokdonia sinensis]|uniref:Gliding motility-associated C-terminal domain-containing protein n=1 Tax=Dokdonia sinensis TaxID=2479847 RepID=A0A3M0GUF7_9FLAO|nr:T9SS type B sorting domain-containing protein [Dokdonia sinensis]RMB60956.1 gliding motility-associated C-terminal domain-containing protein [Dokdonia sinensis]
MRRQLFIIFFFLFLTAVQAQREAAHWYFGSNAGIRFNPDGSVETLSDGSLNTLEGCAAISDRFGSLLFYTDGVTVYDRTHQVMPGGSGLLGDPSSAQSAIIVPKPDSNTIYYIFTVAALEPGETPLTDLDKLKGLNYYVVDLDEGPNGSVIEHGNDGMPLLIPNSEKITAVRAADCSAIWVITHFGDSFYSFNVSAAGVDSNAVVSQTALEVPFPVHRRNAIGYLKASPDGTRLGIAHQNLSSIVDTDAPGALLLYDFNTLTGAVTNEIELDISSGTPYGVEFSPNSQVFYATVQTGNINNVFQYDLSISDISSSTLSTGSTSSGALQLAANGKIYHSSFETSLNVIENPNTVGQGADYRRRAVPLGGRSSNFGLPPFIQSLFNEVVDITGLTNDEGVPLDQVTLCTDDEFTFEVQNPIPGSTYTWFFDDGVAETILNCSGPECAVNNVGADDSGLYRVEIDPMNGDCPLEGFGFMTVLELPAAQIQSLTQCDIDVNDSTDGITFFNLEETIDVFTEGIEDIQIRFYENDLDLSNERPIINLVGYQNTIPFSQELIVEIRTDSGCRNIGRLELIVQPTLSSLPKITTLYACDESTEAAAPSALFNIASIAQDLFPGDMEISFYSSREDAILEKNSLPFTAVNFPNTTLYVRSENENDCVSIVTIDLVIDATPTVDFPSEFLVCLNQVPQELTAPDGFDRYSWSRSGMVISENKFLTLEEPGNYTLEVAYAYSSEEGMRECTTTIDFTAFASNIATIEEIEVTDVSENNTLLVTASGEGDYEYSITSPAGPYQESPFFENVEPGIINVYVRDKNGCGFVVDEIAVIGIPRFFTPNGDGINDFWRIKGLSREFPTVKEILIFDRFGKLLANVAPLGAGWDGNYNGNPLPVNGYWYHIELADGRVFKGPFTLIRRG